MNRTIRLQSIFIGELESAIVRVVLSNNVMKLSDIWRSGVNNYDVIGVVAEDIKAHSDSFESQAMIINDDGSGSDGRASSDKKKEPKNILQQAVYQTTVHHGWIYPVAVWGFSPMSAMALFYHFKKGEKVVCESCDQWPKLEAELERIHERQSPAVMAFLQAILYKKYELTY